MEDFVIETQIDKLIDLLSKKRKIALSEAARVMNVKESQMDAWISTLEDRGVVELKYPVLGEPEIVLKGIMPENIRLAKEDKKMEERKEAIEEKKSEEVYEAPKEKVSEYAGEYEIREERKPTYERIETEEIKALEEKVKNLEADEKEVKALEEKMINLEKRVIEVTEEIDISKLKEELFETLIIISALNDIEKITNYLGLIEKIVLVLKAKKAWDEVDKDLMISTLRSMSENWRESKKEGIAKTLEEMAKKIETI